MLQASGIRHQTEVAVSSLVSRGVPARPACVRLLFPTSGRVEGRHWPFSSDFFFSCRIFLLLPWSVAELEVLMIGHWRPHSEGIVGSGPATTERCLQWFIVQCPLTGAKRTKLTTDRALIVASGPENANVAELRARPSVDVAQKKKKTTDGGRPRRPQRPVPLWPEILPVVSCVCRERGSRLRSHPLTTFSLSVLLRFCEQFLEKAFWWWCLVGQCRRRGRPTVTGGSPWEGGGSSCLPFRSACSQESVRATFTFSTASAACGGNCDVDDVVWCCCLVCWRMVGPVQAILGLHENDWDTAGCGCPSTELLCVPSHGLEIATVQMRVIYFSRILPWDHILPELSQKGCRHVWWSGASAWPDVLCVGTACGPGSRSEFMETVSRRPDLVQKSRGATLRPFSLLLWKLHRWTMTCRTSSVTSLRCCSLFLSPVVSPSLYPVLSALPCTSSHFHCSSLFFSSHPLCISLFFPALPFLFITESEASAALSTHYFFCFRIPMNLSQHTPVDSISRLTLCAVFFSRCTRGPPCLQRKVYQFNRFFFTWGHDPSTQVRRARSLTELDDLI